MGVSEAVLRMLPADAPLDPDREEARRLLEEELQRSRYQQGAPAAQPSWIDDLLRWLDRLTGSLGGAESAPGWILVLVLVGLAVLVIAFLVFGVPRMRRRSAVVGDDLFEADDHRDAAAMRRDADAAAHAGRYAEAMAERFRAIARALHERTLVTTLPGSTAHDVARRAAVPLPEHAQALEGAAHDFDAVRYLGDPGDRERYESLVALDTAVQRTRPQLAETIEAAPTPASGVEPFARVEP